MSGKDDFFEHDAVPVAAAAGKDDFFEHDAVPAGPMPIPKEEPGLADTAISAVANGLTFGMAPQIVAKARAKIAGITGSEKRPDGFSPTEDELYDKYLKEGKGYDQGAHDANPKTSTALNLGASVLNPVNKLLPGGGLLKNVGTGIGIGAVTGAVKSDHDLSNYDEAKALGKDVATDAGIGAVGGVVGTAAGKAIGAIPGLAKKSASVLLGAPEDSVERLIANPQGVNGAAEVPEYVQRVKGLVGNLKDRVVNGSQESRQHLSGEDTRHTGQDVANFFQSKIDDIVSRSEGALSPRDAATVKYLEMQKAPFVGENAEKVFSGNRVKNLVQDLRSEAKFSRNPGEFSSPDDVAIKNVARTADQSIKAKSPAYADAMVDQARKTDLLNQLQNTFKTDSGLAGLLDRVRRDRAPFAEDLFNRLDKEFGTTTVDDLRNSLAKEAFDKSATNGSRNVNLYKQIIGDWAEKQHIPFGKAIGALTGATVDKYGPGIARGGINAYNAVSGSPVVQDFLRGAQRTGQSLGTSPSLNPAVVDYLLNKYGK